MSGISLRANVKCINNNHSFFFNFSNSYYHLVGTNQMHDYVIGQRVHAVGRINSQNFWSDDGKLKQKIIVHCKALRLLNGDVRSDDFNRVHLRAQISSDIQNLNNHSSFSMTTVRTRFVKLSHDYYYLEIAKSINFFSRFLAEVDHCIKRMLLNIIEF